MITARYGLSGWCRPLDVHATTFRLSDQSLYRGKRLVEATGLQRTPPYTHVMQMNSLFHSCRWRLQFLAVKNRSERKEATVPYRGLPYIVTQKADYNSRVDMYANEHRRLPSSTHGIRYSSTPRRRPGVATFAPPETVTPASADPNPRSSKDLERINPKRALAAVAAIVLFALVCAFAGIVVARAITGFVSGGEANPYGNDNTTRAASLSETHATWQRGTVPTLYQDDPQWADRPYGPGTIASAGAAPLCLAMVYIESTGDVETDPVEVASFSQRSGYADSPDATPLLTDGATELGLAVESVEASESSIRHALVGGRPVIAAVGPGAFGNESTYIVLADIDERGMLIVRDPLSSERSSRHWSFEEICTQSKALWCYQAS